MDSGVSACPTSGLRCCTARKVTIDLPSKPEQPAPWMLCMQISRARGVISFCGLWPPRTHPGAPAKQDTDKTMPCSKNTTMPRILVQRKPFRIALPACPGYVRYPKRIWSQDRIGPTPYFPKSQRKVRYGSSPYRASRDIVGGIPQLSRKPSLVKSGSRCDPDRYQRRSIRQSWPKLRRPDVRCE